MKRSLVLIAMLAALPVSALAHKAWLLPSQTVIAGEAPWITVDAAVSNDL
ncbi:ABC transporter permease, partial [Xanthomonas hortorum pv. gardneri]